MRTDTGPRAERNGSVITVALVDDHAAIRSGLAMILRQHDDIDVVAEAGDGASAITVTRTHQPDVVLMDVRMPGTDGIEATRQIIGDDPQPGSGVDHLRPRRIRLRGPARRCFGIPAQDCDRGRADQRYPQRRGRRCSARSARGACPDRRVRAARTQTPPNRWD